MLTRRLLTFERLSNGEEGLEAGREGRIGLLDVYEYLFVTRARKSSEISETDL